VKRVALVFGLALALVASATAAAPARLLVGAKEFRFTLSRTSIKAGPAIIQLQNFGEDDHNLNLQRIGGKRVYKIATVSPGADVGELDARLAPGKYKLWCSLADHAARGMRATLIVKK
jgi:plastocyanin